MSIQKITVDFAKIANVKAPISVNLDKNDWRDGLIIRTPNWLGDAVMALPAIYSIRKVVPQDCAIFALTTKNNFPLFDSINCLDRVLTLSNSHSMWSKNEISRVAHAKLGVALLFNASFRDAFFFRYAMPFAKIFGISSRFNNLFLTQGFRFNSPEIKLEKIHQGSKYLAMAYAFGAPLWDGKFPEFKEAKEPEITDPMILEISKLNNLLAIAPGAAYGPAKKWQTANFAKFCEFWIEQKNGYVAILGSKSDLETALQIKNMLNSDKIFNLAGKTDLYDVIRILKNASFCLANDSGIMHLAAALNRPGFAIFGSTDPAVTAPLSSRWISFYSACDCSPCFKRYCPRNSYECLSDISSDFVIQEYLSQKET